MAQRWFAAFNDKDLERLLALYDDNARHFSPKLKVRHPETNGLIKGKSALRSWWQDAFDRLPSLHYEIVRLTPHEDRVFMEYVRHVKGEADLFVGEMLEIKNGVIVRSVCFTNKSKVYALLIFLEKNSGSSGNKPKSAALSCVAKKVKLLLALEFKGVDV